jgi:uncharacterized protein (TIGR00730 family)
MAKANRHTGGPRSIVSLGDEAEALELVANSIMSLWDVVNNLTRLRPTQRERYRVTIFGSARVPEDHWVYAAVRDVAEELTRLGCDIVTGGGPGLMAAANEGARRAGASASGRSVGIRVELPFEQDVNAFVTEAYEHRTFFTRLHQFVLMSDAFVVMPGGIGTVLEAMMIWQLLQVGHLQGTPLILAGKMYAELVVWCRRHMLLPELCLAHPEDLNLPQCVDDGPGILRILHADHGAWAKRRSGAPRRSRGDRRASNRLEG